MSKLRKQIKVMARRRTHREQVQKRKIERAQREKERALEDRDDAAEIEREVDELLRAEAAGESLQGNEAAHSTKIMIGGLLVQKAQAGKKPAKKLTRKQARRKEQNVERGKATADSLARKWEDKKKRVKARAQVRNSELQN